jgi:hypothetical protein
VRGGTVWCDVRERAKLRRRVGPERKFGVVSLGWAVAPGRNQKHSSLASESFRSEISCFRYSSFGGLDSFMHVRDD